MKVKYALLAVLVLLSALFASCEERSSHATMRVNLRKDRSIVPADYPLEIKSYRITGDGPGSESFSIETNKETVSLEGLVIGEWSLLAEGLNENDDVLVTGSTTHRLSATNGSCTIVLEDLTGMGSLEVVLTWDPERISGEASIELELTPQYGDKETRRLELTSMDGDGGRATYTGTDYPSGSYVLAARLFDGSVQVAGFTEAVRIAGDQVSEGEIAFDLDKYPVEPGTLELVDNTGIPVSCMIEGITDTVDADMPVRVSITSETDDVSSYAIVWYLDGNQIGEGPEVEFTPLVGSHRLDVVASTSRLGTSGSASVNFEAVSASAPGVPSHGNVIEDGEGIDLSGKTVVRFLPDGNAMILSNAEQRVQIASPIRSSLDVIRSYTFTELGITGDVVDFDSVEISAGLSKVLMSQDNPYLVSVYNYNPSTASLTRFSEGVPMALGNPDEQEITGIGAVAIADGITVDGCPIGIVNVHNPQSDIWQYTYVSLGAETGDSNYFWQGMFMSQSGMHPDPAGRPAVTSDSFFQVMDDGQGLLIQRTENSVNTFSLMAYFRPFYSFPDDEEKFSGVTAGTLLDTATVLVLGDYMAICEYDQDFSGAIGGWKLHSAEIMDHDASSLVTTKDRSYAYYVDIDADEIVTLKIASNGRSVEEIGRTALSIDGVNSIAISESGSNIIAYNENNAVALVVMRATR